MLCVFVSRWFVIQRGAGLHDGADRERCKKFMTDNFGSDWVLWEAEVEVAECERDNGIWDDKCEVIDVHSC